MDEPGRRSMSLVRVLTALLVLINIDILLIAVLVVGLQSPLDNPSTVPSVPVASGATIDRAEIVLPPPGPPTVEETAIGVRLALRPAPPGGVVPRGAAPPASPPDPALVEAMATLLARVSLLDGSPGMALSAQARQRLLVAVTSPTLTPTELDQAFNTVADEGQRSLVMQLDQLGRVRGLARQHTSPGVREALLQALRSPP